MAEQREAQSQRVRKKSSTLGMGFAMCSVLAPMLSVDRPNSALVEARPRKTIATGMRSEYAGMMLCSVERRSSFWFASLFASIVGCGGASNEHHYVPPKLPPMDVAEEVLPTKAPVAGATAPTNPVPAASTAMVEPAPTVPTAAVSQKEPGRASGPCPSTTDQAPHILAQAFAAEKTTTDPGPHRAIAEAIRMRLDTLFQHGCHRRLNDEQLLEEIVKMADDPKGFKERLEVNNLGDLGLTASYGTYSGGFLAHYQWHDGMIRTRILVTGEQGDLDKQLLALTARVAKLPSYPEPVLVLGNTHPWMSSCWRAMRIRVLAPSGDPINPKVLLNRPADGRWCEGISSEVKGDTVSFTYDNFGGPWSFGMVQRTYTFTFQFDGSAFVERFGFAPKLEYLPEDWLMREWNLSQEATVDSARERLQPMHEKMHKALVASEKKSRGDDEYTLELFPVSDIERRVALYCVHRDTQKPCKQWPTPVDFFIERQDKKWYVKDVVPRVKK